MKVGDLMTSEVLTIGPDAPLKEAAIVMVKAGISGLPVLGDDRVVIGIITEADFVTAEADRSWGGQRRRLLSNILEDTEHPHATVVSDVMTLAPHCIDTESSVTEAARKMTELGVKRLPVTKPDGTLDGIISRADVMSAFARPDEALKDEIVDVVAAEVLQLDVDSLSVGVEDGIVSLGGTVPTRTEARLLVELSSRVEGVISVETAVTWLVDDTMSASEA